MSEMSFPSILMFLEGTMERLFINNNFHYITVVPLKNGRDVPISFLCKFMESTLRLRGVYDLVIVWLDREERGEEAEDIARLMRESLLNQGIAPDKVFVGVADRMTENWILADEELITQFFELEKYTYTFEGAYGVGKLEDLFKEAGRPYRKTTDGVLLLKKRRLREAAKRSASARCFIEHLNIDCWWLTERALDTVNENAGAQ